MARPALDDPEPPGPGRTPGWLDLLERVGNRLPDPATLFLLGTGAVLVASQVVAAAGLRVPRPGGAAGDELVAVGLLDSEGLYWLLDNLVENFVRFPPLGIVLVGMLGIGVAERSGFVGALLRALLLGVPRQLLTPAVFLVGVLSSVALDAGYVVLPPVAAALFHAVGRPPVVGLAAVFAGVSAGFSANLVVTGLDPILAGFSEAGARILDPGYRVAATANWWFMIASTFVLTAVGWAVTARFVEPRYRHRPPEEGGTPPPAEKPEASEAERRALRAALAALALLLGLVGAAVLVPGAPLHGSGGRFPRWVTAIVPLLFVSFLVPGVVYGARAGTIRSDRDVARLMGETMAAMGPYIVLAFFAAQFVAAFAHSGLGEMVAVAGGRALARAALPTPVLLIAFIAVVSVANLFIGSMSAKYAFLAPVFVPMFMQVGVSPELVQAAYRVGDSVTNVITPLNPYLVIILVFLQRYVPRAGIGTLVALMLPYSLAFLLAWTALLLVFVGLGVELGPAGPLHVPPAG